MLQSLSLCKSGLNGFENCCCMVFIMLHTIFFNFNILDGRRDFVLFDDLDTLQYSCKESINALWYGLFITFGDSFWPIGESCHFS